MDDVIFNKEKMSTEDMISATKEIFNSQVEDFQKLKKSKWYHIFLRSFTLKGHERYIINGIKSFNKLQQLFIKFYVCEIKGMYAEIDEIVGNALEQNKVIEKLYNACILRIEKQKEPAELDQQDMKILTMFLGEYENSDGTIPEEVQKYNCNVFNSLPIQMAYGDFDGTQLDNVSEPEIFYRCFVEQCMVADTLESQDWSDNVYNSLRHINLGEAAKERIKSAVKKEVRAAGIEYLYKKYTETTFQFSYLDFELFENSSGLSGNNENAQDQGETEDFEAFGANNANYETNESCPKEDYTEIGGMICESVCRMMKQNNLQKRNEKIFSFIQKYNSSIAFDAAIEYVKLSDAEILFTTCGMNVASKSREKLTNIKYADIDSKWVLSTDKENARLGCTKLIIDDRKGHRLEVEGKSDYIEEIVNILSNSSSYTSATTDIIIDEKEWPIQAKCLMGEILVDVYEMCYKTSTIEAWRLFNDLSVSIERICELFVYYGNSEPGEESIKNKIKKFIQYIPYPSEKSAGFKLACKIVEMVQFSSGKPDERPINIRKVIENICDICKLHDYRGSGLNSKTDQKKEPEAQKETWDKLWDIGALPYRILKKKATKKEINEIGLELAGVAVGVGVPVAVSVVDSILFWASLGIAFVPGVDLIFWPAWGAMFTGGAVGGGVVKGIVNKVKQEDINAASVKELWKVEKSYVNLYNNIQSIEDDNIRKKITDEIIKAAGKTDFGIKECIRVYSAGGHTKDEFYIQAIKEKLSAKSTENKSGFVLKTLLDIENDKSAETLSKILKQTYYVPVNNRKYNLQHHQILAIYESKKSKDSALAFTYEGLAITKKMIGDGNSADKFVFYREITKFRSDREKLLLYLTIGHTNKKEDEVAISFFNPDILKELLIRLRQIGVTVFS